MVAVTVVVPASVLVTIPTDVTAATLSFEDVQDTQRVTSAGRSLSEVAAALVTVKLAVPTSPSNNAVMVAVPGWSPVA